MCISAKRFSARVESGQKFKTAAVALATVPTMVEPSARLGATSVLTIALG